MTTETLEEKKRRLARSMEEIIMLQHQSIEYLEDQKRCLTRELEKIDRALRLKTLHAHDEYQTPLAAINDELALLQSKHGPFKLTLFQPRQN